MTARSEHDEQILDQAIAWQAALEQDDADWDGYLAWLEEDPRHREAFDSIVLLDAAIAENRDSIAAVIAPPSVMPDGRRAARWRPKMLWGGAIAAGLAIMVAVPNFYSKSKPATYDNAGTVPRSLTLANGINVTLAPSSRIVVTGKDAAAIELARGEAYFDVRHDPARTLTVSAGQYRVSDIGTRFAVNLGNGSFRVGVADGTVSVITPSAAKAVMVFAGHQLAGGNGDLTLSPVDSAQVGSWRTGRLSYTDAPLGLVATDITRYSGKTIIVDPSVEKRHFSGSLVIGDGSRLVGDLATVMGIDAQTTGDAVRVSAAR